VRQSLKVALVGNPNSGKTSLFNALTHCNNYTGNWAGVTVELASGYYSYGDTDVAVIDLPGIYSLVATMDASIDETVTTDFIHNNPNVILVNVIDATNLQKDLYLTLQLLEMGKPMIIAINFLKRAYHLGLNINLQYLAEQLNCPVVAVSSLEKHGIGDLNELKRTIALDRPNHGLLNYILPEAINQTLQRWHAMLPNMLGLRVLEGDAVLSQKLMQSGIDVNGELKAVQDLVNSELDISVAKIRHRKINDLLELSTQKLTKAHHHTPKLFDFDKILLHKYWGLPIFFVIMYLMFALAINLGGYLQEYFDTYSSYLFMSLPAKALTLVHAPQWLNMLLIDGVGKGLNVTLTFIPVLAMMYLALALIESIGYMARAAFIVDKIMRWFGLSGKSFVPMIVGFGCNVPAIMATRTISNYSERILSIMMTPFMSCSARLAIYAIFVATFFPHGGHNVIFSLYLVGILLAILTSLFLRKSVLTTESSSSLMEFPAYRLPALKVIFKQTNFRLKKFITKAGVMIIPLCVVLGFIGTKHLESIGKKVTPIFAPIGINSDNWQATVGLLAGLVAKETLIGTYLRMPNMPC
jgi:ferrous iron transport protein B